MHRIDQAQDFISQCEITQNGAGKTVDAFRFAVGNAVDRRDRFGQGGKIALVAHATQQEFHCRLRIDLATRHLQRRLEIIVERGGKLFGTLIA